MDEKIIEIVCGDVVYQYRGSMQHYIGRRARTSTDPEPSGPKYTWVQKGESWIGTPIPKS